MTPARVLIVEDDDVTAYLNQRILKKMGMEVCGRAVTADEAVQLAGRSDPDFVLMDIGLLGGRDGIEAACEILARFGIPSIFVTAETSPDTRRQALAADPLGYINKPLDALRLRQCLGLEQPGAAPPVLGAAPAS